MGPGAGNAGSGHAASPAVPVTFAFCVSPIVPTLASGLIERKAPLRSTWTTAKGCGICAYECPRGVITMEDLNV